MQYYECPNCGASLDPGEICDCSEKKEVYGGNGNG